MYTLKPNRLAITLEGPTEAEAPIVARHWAHLQELAARKTLIFAGRTLVTTEDCFASAVIRANSESEARSIMEGDPAIKEGLMRGQLFRYQVLLMGEPTWLAEEASC
jgi:uncharacterized protein YciI